MLKILFCFADGYSEYNSSHFRVSIQADELNKRSDVTTRALNIKDWIHGTQAADYLTMWADIIVLQRVLVDELIGKIESLMTAGKTIICDWDDAYDLIGEENAAYKFWGKGQGTTETRNGIKFDFNLEVHPVEQMKANLPKITAATMPSKVIASDWANYVNTNYLPNYLDARYWEITQIITPHILIGWGGSLSHLTSFSHSGVQGALHKILKVHDKAVFLLCGDDRIKAQLPFKDKLVFRPYVTWMDWPMSLSLYSIGVAPLAMPYDARRSWLKVAEYIAAGIPFVATKSAPYEDLFSCKSGIFVDQGELDTIDKQNESGWFDALNEVLTNFEAYKKTAQEERGRFKEILSVTHNSQFIKDFYENLKNIPQK